MNEQIEILFKQAGGYVEVDNDGNYFTYTQDFDPEKFAELIVRECGEIAYKAYWDNPETVRGIHIKEKIKKHFGVAE
jgi:hypothetical protein